jgi:hypothetical protein
MLEELQDFEVWKEWKGNPSLLDELKKKHIDIMI